MTESQYFFKTLTIGCIVWLNDDGQTQVVLTSTAMKPRTVEKNGGLAGRQMAAKPDPDNDVNKSCIGPS